MHHKRTISGKSEDAKGKEDQQEQRISIVEYGTIDYEIEQFYDSDMLEGNYKNVEIKWSVTNQGKVIGYCFQKELFLVDTENIFKLVEENIRPFVRGLELTKNGKLPIFSENVFVGEDYVVISLPSVIFSFRFRTEDTDRRHPVVYDFKKIKHTPITHYENISLYYIVITSHPDRFLIIYNFKNASNTIIWDIKENREIDNFAARDGDELMFYAHSPEAQVMEALAEDQKQKARLKKKRESREHIPENERKYYLSHTGYLMFNNYYVNLSTLIPTPFMKFKDDRIHPTRWGMGPRVNFDETLVLANGSLYSVYSYQDVYFRTEKDTYATKRADACKYFVDRKSVISDFVMEDDKLAKILDLLKEDPLMYLMILMPDNKGVTPLDEAIENNSPRIVEMFLNHLRDVSEFKLSKMVYLRFIDLFDMGIEAFRNFLSICYFTTEQMDMMKKMESSGKDGTLRWSADSSILSEKFNKVFLKDKKIKDDSKKTEQQQLAEENKLDESIGHSDGDDDKDDETLMSDVSIPEINDESAFNFDTSIAVEKRVEVKAIEFDWILKSHEGEEFLQRLSETDNLEYFQIDLIKNIIWFQWSYFLPRIIAALFIPFLAFFLLFILYTTWLINEKHEEEEDWGPWHRATFGVSLAILIFQAFFVYVEMHQLYFHRLLYFKSFWNILDIISIFLNVTVVILDLSGADEDDVNAVACIAVLVLWFRLFYLLRVFSETAYLISMIQAIILEMKYFVLALVIAILAFANTFYILGRNSDEENFSGDNIWDAFIFSYKMGLGDFDTENFNTPDEALVWFLWFLNTLIILIILLNLVIAIMGDTFDRVQETQESTMLQEFSSIMRENEFLFSRKRVFNNIKYIIVIQPEKAEGGVTSTWEGKLNQLKRFLEDSSEKHIVHLKKMEKKLEKMIEQGLEEKLKPTEDKINQKIATLELRLQKANKIFAQYPVKELLEKVLALEGKS